MKLTLLAIVLLIGVALPGLAQTKVNPLGQINNTAHTSSVPLACVAASGSGTAYTCTTSPTFVPAANDAILFKADVASTGAMTLNVNSSSAAPVKKNGGASAIVANDFIVGQYTLLEFDGTNWQMQGQTGNGGAPTGAAGGDLSGTYPNPTVAKSSANPFSVSAITTKTVGTIYQVDGFPFNGCTVGATTYTTQLDCAFYTSLATAVTNSNSVALVLGAGYYNTCAELLEPSAFYTVDIIGQSVRTSFLNKTCSTPTLPVIGKGTASQGADLELRNFTIQANGDANSCADLWAVINGMISDISCSGVIDGSSHYFQFGDPGNFATGAFEQTHVSHVSAANTNFSVLNVRASITPNVVGGAITSYTVNSGGSGYSATDLVVLILGFGHGTQPCTVMPASPTVTLSGGVVTGVTPTGSNGSGCTGTIDVQVLNIGDTTYVYDLAASSDSTFDDVVAVGDGRTSQFHVDGGNNTFNHLHPTYPILGILNSIGNNVYSGTECDEPAQYCFDFEDGSGSSVNGSSAFTFNSTEFLSGYSTFYFGASGTNVQFGEQANLYTAGAEPTDFHEFITQTGPYDAGNPLPLSVTTMAQAVWTGQIVLGTSAITSGAKATVVTKVVAGVNPASPYFDKVSCGFGSDPSGVTGYAPSASGMLTIIPYVVSGNVNVYVYNNTGGSITPGAMTLNCQVTR